MKDSLTDDQLLEALQGNATERDRAIDNYFYSDPQHLNWTINFVLSLNGTREDAEEVYQEAVIAFEQNARKQAFNKESQLRSYFYGIVKNKWFVYFRAKRKTVALNDQEVEAGEPFPELEERSEEKAAVLQYGLQQLDPRCLGMLKAHYLEKQPMKVIAVEFGFPHERRAINQMARCKDYLRKKMRKHPLYPDTFENNP